MIDMQHELNTSLHAWVHYFCISDVSILVMHSQIPICALPIARSTVIQIVWKPNGMLILQWSNIAQTDSQKNKKIMSTNFQTQLCPAYIKTNSDSLILQHSHVLQL